MATPNVPNTPNPNPHPSNPDTAHQPLEFPREPAQPDRTDPRATPSSKPQPGAPSTRPSTPTPGDESNTE